MSTKRNRIMELAGLSHRSRLLVEEEGEDLFGDDENKDDADKEDSENKDDKEGDADSDAESKEGEEKEEEPAEKVDTADVAKYGPGEIDQKVDSVLKTAFADAIKAGAVKTASSLGYPGADDVEGVSESADKYNMASFLFENEEIEATPEEFDLDYFTSEVARYIKNYDTLLDMEGMLFNKARQFLLNQFGPEMEAKFVESLALSHDLDFNEEYVDPEQPPIAVGGNLEAAPS